MWTVENRGQYNRDQLRYPSDVTDEEWEEICVLDSSGSPGRTQAET